jgi:addiction module RelE/StbE family toxin
VTVILSPAAENDLAGIYAYYSTRDYEHAERLVRAILLACDGLAEFPLIGKMGKVEGTRERLITRYPYRLVYRIAGETIEVVRILHQRQQWPPAQANDE